MAADMKQDPQSDTMTDASSTTFGINTPSATIEASESLWSSRGAIPWPENTLQIIEKESGKVIAHTGDVPKLQDLKDTKPGNTHWVCVKQNGYFGFQTPITGGYLGHDGKMGMQTRAFQLRDWELWTPREHPEGGYELLTPYYSHTLMILCVDEDGETLVRRRHGTTLWEFVRV